MATVTRHNPDVRVLQGITFKTYVRMIRHPGNRHLRMAYHNGTLEIVSPIHYAHEGASRRLSLIVLIVAKALGLRANGTGSLTIHRAGDGPVKGVGKEPDQAFYIGSLNRFPYKRNLDLKAGDPPPDLWIEVDHRVSSRGRLPVYATLGVPEVWQYRVSRRTIKFLRLGEGVYRPIDQSLSLPVLTPSRVLEAMSAGEEMAETDFMDYLQNWAAELIVHEGDDFRAE